MLILLPLILAILFLGCLLITGISYHKRRLIVNPFKLLAILIFCIATWSKYGLKDWNAYLNKVEIGSCYIAKFDIAHIYKRGGEISQVLDLDNGYVLLKFSDRSLVRKTELDIRRNYYKVCCKKTD